MLRIHRAIVLLAVIGTISITWYLRTKNMDFLNPSGVDPGEDKENTNIATGGASVQPDIPEAPEPDPILPKDPPEPAEPEVTPITEADLGDLETVRAARRLTVKPRVGFGSVTVEAYSVCAWLHACMRV